MQASSGGTACTGNAQTNIEQSEGPFLFQSVTGGAVRLKSFWVSLSDASPASTLVGVSVLDGLFGLQLAQSSSGPYVTVAARPVAPPSNGIISTQGLVAAWNPEDGAADFQVFDWNPVKQAGAPLWQTIFNVDLWNSDSASHTVVLTTSLLLEEFQEDVSR